MEVLNSLYKNQGIHVISSIFTVDKGITKVLLVKRTNNPHNGMWALPSGALYNNENLTDGVKRELKEKTGLDNIELSLCNVFGDVNRSSLMRMIGISYLGVIDSNKVEILKETLKTSDASFIPIDKIPALAYDHNEIINDALEKLKTAIFNSDILKLLFPKTFTLPEIQKTYESILGIKYDRRNFRKKMLNLLEDTNKEKIFEGKKPAKLYKFK